MSSLISILSSDHGRLRREQRDISKRDLLKALRYGSREWSTSAWKIEYDGIIFIVNKSLTQEITAFPSPLALAPVDTKDRILQKRTRDLFMIRPDLCTSHTVLVVDVSGSMTTHDIALHRDRQIAAYSSLAMEYIAEQLFKQTARNSDIVSLVEFNRTSQVVLYREPFSWTLYNKLLNRRDSRSFARRERENIHDQIHGDSNYLAALEVADGVLRTIEHDRCALSLLFLSDGAPTDAKALGITPLDARRRMVAKISGMSQRYAAKLNVHMLGFGNALQDFSVLESLVEAVESTNSGAKAEYTYCGKIASKMASAMSSLVSSTTETRTQLLEQDLGKSRDRREVQLESETKERNEWSFCRIIGHYSYNARTDNFAYHLGLPPGAIMGVEGPNQEKEKNCLPNRIPPPFLAMKRLPYGKGAERLAFRCQLARTRSEKDFTFNTMVAKETNLVERPNDNIDFHRTFCSAQDLARHLAFEFNSRLKAIPSYSAIDTPRIIFLPCSILILDDPEWRNRGVLVEKKLNTEKYGWNKYNDNAGGLNGHKYHAPVDVELEFAKLEGRIHDNDIIEEEDEEDSEEESSDEDVHTFDSKEGEGELLQSNRMHQNDPVDFIHAFTHFTYVFTNKQVMVCDLQGVYNYDMKPPTFELTDPAIHYKSKSGKKNIFGRTDAGEDGMQLFLKTHMCTSVCKLMQLSRRNENWKKLWRARTGGVTPPVLARPFRR